MGRELYIADSSGTMVDVTKFVDKWPTQIVRTSDGPEPQAKFEIKGALMGPTVEDTLSAILTGGIQYGRTVLFRDTNYTPTKMMVAGTVKVMSLLPRPGAYNYEITVTGFLDELNIPIGYILFPDGSVVYNGTTYDCRYDSHRIRFLLDQFLPTWDHTNSHVADPAYQVYSGLATGHYKTTVLKLIKEFSSFPGTDAANPRIPRRWFPWAELTGTSTYTKYMDYSPRESVGTITPTLHYNPSAATDIPFFNAERKIDGSSVINAIIIGGPQGEATTVSWANAVNVSVAGSKLTKTGGSGSAWDAGAFSEQSIGTDGGYAQFTLQFSNKAVAVGFSTGDTGQTESGIHFRIQTTALGGYSVYLDSTNLYTDVYAANDQFKIEIRRNHNSSGTVYWQGFIYQGSSGSWIQKYAIAFTPAQLDDGTHGGTNNFPLFIDTSLFTSTGVIKDVFIRSHSYDTFIRADSVGSPNNYGYKWAADVLHDDALNTYELRRQRAEGVFNARAYPRDTFTCETNGLQVNGTHFLFEPGLKVNVYEPSFSWTPQALFIARVTYDWGDSLDGYPKMKLELGDRILEDGEIENIVLRTVALDTEAPDIPTGLNVISQTGTNAGVNVNFGWTQTTHDEQFIDLRCMTGNSPTVIRRFSATVDSGIIEGLQVNTTYDVDISATDFAGNSSPFGNGIRFTTTNPAPDPPTSVAIASNTYDSAAHMTRILATWTHSPSSFVQGYIIYVTENNVATDIYYTGYTTQYTFYVHPGAALSFYLKAVSVSGALSIASNTATGTAASPDSYLFLFNASFEEGVRFHPEWPAGWALSSTTLVTRVTGNALDGLYAAKLDSTGGGSQTLTSSNMVVPAGKKLSVKYAAQGNASGTYLTADLLWFKNDGTSNGSYNLHASTTVNALWTPYKVSEIDVPTNTAYVQIKFTNTAAGSRILYIDNVSVMIELENNDIVDHSIALTKIYKYLDDALYNPDFYVVTTKDATQPDGWTLANDLGCTQAVDTSKAIKGGYSLKQVYAATLGRTCTATSSPIAIMNTAAGGVGNQYAVQYRASLNGNAATGTYYVKADWWGSGGLITTQVLATGSIPSGGTTRFGSVVPPAGCIYGYMVLVSESTGTGNTVWWSACKFEEALVGAAFAPTTELVAGQQIKAGDTYLDDTGVGAKATGSGTTTNINLTSLTGAVIGRLRSMDTGSDPREVQLYTLMANSIMTILSQEILKLQSSNSYLQVSAPKGTKFFPGDGTQPIISLNSQGSAISSDFIQGNDDNVVFPYFPAFKIDSQGNFWKRDNNMFGIGSRFKWRSILDG